MLALYKRLNMLISYFHRAERDRSTNISWHFALGFSLAINEMINEMIGIESSAFA